jgi:Fic family protein
LSIYIHEDAAWPEFSWDRQKLSEPLAALRHEQGRLMGRMEGLGFPLRQTALLQTLTDDVLKTSEIEGEKLELAQVRSSLARRLGMDIGGLKPADRHVDGVVEMLLDATRQYDQPLSAERLFSWHAALFPTGRSGMAAIRTGAWRDDHTGPMQVVSGAMGHERVHYEAPAAGRLDREMQRFFDWFNSDAGMDGVEKAAIAHLWFVTIHPFDDGNGRIARAIADLALARSEASSQRFYSMSAQIRKERARYYEILEQTQKGTMDVTAWMSWFLACLRSAIGEAKVALGGVVSKAAFWESMTEVALNERQRHMLNRLLDGFQGKLTSSKWAQLTKCSPDTALRDIQGLIDRNILARNPGGGRSTSYALVERTSSAAS